MEIDTVKLRDGSNVYAVKTKTGIHPKCYTNYKQADKQAEILKQNGIECFVLYGKTIKYIIIKQV